MSVEVKRVGRLSREGQGVWTKTEHERFLEARRVYPNGPWKLVAEYIGTRSTRQTMTHAQKYRQKLERRMRGLRSNYRKNKNQSSNVSSTNDAGAQDDGNSSSSDEQRSGDEGSAFDDDMDVPFDIVVDVNTSNANANVPYKTIEGSSPHSVSYTSLLTNMAVSPTSGPLTVAAAYDDYYNVLSEIADENAVLTHHASNSTDLPWVDDYLDYIVQQFA